MRYLWKLLANFETIFIPLVFALVPQKLLKVRAGPFFLTFQYYWGISHKQNRSCSDAGGRRHYTSCEVIWIPFKWQLFCNQYASSCTVPHESWMSPAFFCFCAKAPSSSAAVLSLAYPCTSTIKLFSQTKQKRHLISCEPSGNAELCDEANWLNLYKNGWEASPCMRVLNEWTPQWDP